MARFKKTIIIAISLLLTVAILVGCNKDKKIDTKLSFTAMLDKYASAESKETVNVGGFKLTFYTVTGKAETLDQRLDLTRTVSNGKGLIDGKMKTSSVTSGIEQILTSFISLGMDVTDNQTKWIKNYFKGEAYIAGMLGYSENVYNGRMDICENNETPNWLLPKDFSKENKEESMFFGISAADVNTQLLKMTDFLGVVNPFELLFSNNFLKFIDFNTATDSSGDKLNKGEKAFLYTIDVSADTLKASMSKGFDNQYQSMYDILNSVEGTKPDALKLAYYYETYKADLMNMFNFDKIEINAKADNTGKIIALDYRFGMTFTLDIGRIGDIMHAEKVDQETQNKINTSLKSVAAILGSKDGSKNKIDIRMEMSNSEKTTYNKVSIANPKDSIFAPLDQKIDGRKIYTVDKDGNLVLV